MNKLILIFSLIFLTNINSTLCQKVEEEVGFKYVKAEYLMSTERLEDAIKELNDIIKVSPAYKDALMLRANTRYRLGAFKGAKDDIMKSIDAIGITLDAATLLGKAEYSLGNKDAALNSLTAACQMGVQDERVYELRASIYEERGELLKACEDWHTAADFGSTKAAINAKKLCGKRTKSTPPATKIEPPVESDNTPPILDNNDSTIDESDTDYTEETSTDNSSGTSEVVTTSEETESDEVDEDLEDNNTIPPEDNTPNNIEIDEDLTLSIFGQGIGKRKILDRPSILILSDQTGTVAVEVCINENGKVDYAEFNPSKSTLTKNSLVSLAIRKSKEFWFEKSDFKKQCGLIVFNIKGSE